MAENAGTDILLLGLPCSFVTQRWSARKGRAKPAPSSSPAAMDVGRRFGIQSARRTSTGISTNCLICSTSCQVAVFRHIYRRMRPIPGVVGAVVAVEACHNLHPADILPLVRTPPYLCPTSVYSSPGSAPWRKPFGLGKNTVAQRNGEILAARLFDCLHDLDRKAVSVFKRTAVFVRSMVDVFQRELVKQDIPRARRGSPTPSTPASLQQFCASLQRLRQTRESLPRSSLARAPCPTSGSETGWPSR